jgi:hypothetical protein
MSDTFRSFGNPYPMKVKEKSTVKIL